jgi:hypothetical protein
MLALRLGPAEVRFTSRAEGDFGVHAIAERGARQLAVVDRPWKTARQVHGTRTVTVDATTDTVGDADALVTTDPTVAVAVRTADCAPIALASDAGAGVAAIVHAGWRGLLSGVVGEAVETMRSLGSTSVIGALGPCIRPECYEFGETDLDAIAATFGDGVRGVTTGGTPALDVPQAVRAALEMAGVELAYDAGACTACDASRWWSHRARGDAERQASVVWLS